MDRSKERREQGPEGEREIQRQIEGVTVRGERREWGGGVNKINHKLNHFRTKEEGCYATRQGRLPGATAMT